MSISVKVHASSGKVVVTRDGRVQPEYSLDALNEGARKGKNACMVGLVASIWGEAAVRACCAKYGARGHARIGSELHQRKLGAIV